MANLFEKLIADIERNRVKRRLKAAFARKKKAAIPWDVRAQELHDAFGDPYKPEYSGCLEKAP